MLRSDHCWTDNSDHAQGLHTAESKHRPITCDPRTIPIFLAKPERQPLHEGTVRIVYRSTSGLFHIKGERKKRRPQFLIELKACITRDTHILKKKMLSLATSSVTRSPFLPRSLRFPVKHLLHLVSKATRPSLSRANRYGSLALSAEVRSGRSVRTTDT